MFTPGVSTELPLADVRVLAVEQYGAGPWATMQLADLGADVIKVEDPSVGGDVGRYVPPFQEGEHSLFFETFNRNKRSISLDLRVERGRELFGELAAEADAVFSNLRGDLPERLGITYRQLAPHNRRIVCCSLSGFGMTGPRRAEPAYDNVIQALTGWMSLTGEPDGPPTKTGLSLVDISAGYVAALSLLAAVWRARRDGRGCDCDLSLFETALAELNYVATWTASGGWRATRAASSAHPSIVPFQNFDASDGPFAVACSKEHFWRRLCVAIDRPDLIEHDLYADFSCRLENRDQLVSELARTFVDRPRAHWLERLAVHGVPSAAVNEVDDALVDVQTLAREDVLELEHPVLGTVRQVRSPLRVGDVPLPLRRAPFRGEQTEEVLRGVAGLDDEEVERARSSGAFGPAQTACP